MEKVLLIGQLNQTVSSINNFLQSNFHTQICVDKLELVKGMTGIFEPDMAIICLVGVGGLDRKIMDYFETRRQSIPVLLVGNPEECKYFQEYYEGQQFDYLARPITLNELMEKCFKILKKEELVEASEEVEKVEEVVVIKKRIMIVDDSGILLRGVKSMLIEQYDVDVATDGKKAIEKAKRRRPDLILLDYEMPVMDGRETLEEIRNDEELKDIPVVFLTSIANKDSIAQVLKLKPEGYLLKPIDQKRMFEKIESILND